MARRSNPLGVDTTNLSSYRAEQEAKRERRPAKLREEARSKSGSLRHAFYGMSEATHRRWEEAFANSPHNFRVVFPQSENLLERGLGSAGANESYKRQYRQPGVITLIYGTAANLPTAHGLLHQFGEEFEPIGGNYPSDDNAQFGIAGFPLRDDDPAFGHLPLAYMAIEAFYDIYHQDPVFRASVAASVPAVRRAFVAAYGRLGGLPAAFAPYEGVREGYLPFAQLDAMQALLNLTKLSNVQLGRVQAWDQIVREWIPMAELYSGVKFIPAPDEIQHPNNSAITYRCTPEIVDARLAQLGRSLTANILRRLDVAQARGDVYVI
jgi:hypothetical protein